MCLMHVTHIKYMLQTKTLWFNSCDKTDAFLGTHVDNGKKKAGIQKKAIVAGVRGLIVYATTVCCHLVFFSLNHQEESHMEPLSPGNTLGNR